MDPLLPADELTSATHGIAPISDLPRERASVPALQVQKLWHSERHSHGQVLLKKILDLSLILAEDWINVPLPKRKELESCTDSIVLLEALVDENLLTTYQASRLRADKSSGLILGNYRILDRIGAGGMGVVYKGEHIRMRQVVAIKVLSVDADQDPLLLARFYAEMRAVAQIHHPNIVAAMDAGEARPNVDFGTGEPTLHYFVMEYVKGQNLETYVKENGPLPPARACQVICQVARALEEAHKHNLVHRDIKPSNILLTPEDEAKLLDFGLVMQFRSRMTYAGAILGTIDFMSPEQALDASSVDARTDIYSLGATFFWCLTGQTPFPLLETLAQDLVARMSQKAPSVRSLRPDLAPELDAVVACMMSLHPADRYPTPQAVTRALLRFIERDTLLSHAQSSIRTRPGPNNFSKDATTNLARADHFEKEKITIQRVLVVDDEEEIRTICQSFLQGDAVDCDVAVDGPSALQALAAEPYDLVLLDVKMPGMTGLELIRRIRVQPASLSTASHLKLVMFSGHMNLDEMAQMLHAGVDDFLGKPFSGTQLVARIEACLRHKAAEDRSDRLANLLLTVNAELEKNVMARDAELIQTRNELVLAMARIVEQRHTLTPGHLVRMQRFCRALAEEAAQLPLYRLKIDKDFIELLVCCVPLYDIGMVAVPDYLLLKPEKLTGEDRVLLEQHTIIGANALQEVAHQNGSLMSFMKMAGDICKHHHERFDGGGYPNKLRGEAIPLCARITALADVYDALRSWRSYRPGMSHKSALHIMTVLSEGQFDPSLLSVFERCGPRLEAIFRDTAV